MNTTDTMAGRGLEALRGRAFINFEAACLADAGTGAELIGPLRRLGPELDTFAAIPPACEGSPNQARADPASSGPA